MPSRTSEYACALILSDGKALLGLRATHRKAYPGYWDVIGGKIEDGESAQSALTRELGEELAITPRAPRFLESLIDTQIDPDTPPTYHLYAIHDWDGGAPRINNHEHDALRWFSPADMETLPNLAHAAYPAVLRRALA